MVANIAIYLSTDELSILYKAAYLTNQSLQSFVLNAAFLAANKDINAAREEEHELNSIE